jgi:hypothetical protein
VRSVEFHPEAEAELMSAAQYFERHVENLGLDFIQAVRRAYERVAEFPDSGHPFGRRLRRTLVPGSPTAFSTAPSGRAFSLSRSPTSIDGQATGGRVFEEGAARRRGLVGNLVTGRAWVVGCAFERGWPPHDNGRTLWTLRPVLLNMPRSHYLRTARSTSELQPGPG